LKEGIGLRGYAQKDPLVEFKKEAFVLFEDMMRASTTKPSATSTTFKFSKLSSTLTTWIRVRSRPSAASTTALRRSRCRRCQRRGTRF